MKLSDHCSYQKLTKCVGELSKVSGSVVCTAKLAASIHCECTCDDMPAVEKTIAEEHSNCSVLACNLIQGVFHLKKFFFFFLAVCGAYSTS